jgi:hypothetical protein
VADLRQAERDRRAALAAPPAPQPAAPRPVPAYGPARLRHLRRLLHELLLQKTSACPPSAGSTSETILALFESSLGEPFTPSPGLTPTQRVIALGRSLGYFIAQPQQFPLDPPLQRISRSGTYFYNRAPLQRVDVPAWRRSLTSSAATAPKPDITFAEANAELPTWLRNHQHLRPCTAELGESGRALLLLWEVDHGCPFPSAASDRGAPC